MFELFYWNPRKCLVFRKKEQYNSIFNELFEFEVYAFADKWSLNGYFLQKNVENFIIILFVFGNSY